MPEPIVIDQSAARVEWRCHEGDDNRLSFRVRDGDDVVVADPEGDGWEVFGQVRATRGGEVLDELTVVFDGEWVRLERPETGEGLFWHEFHVVSPVDGTRTPVSGPLVVTVDSAVEGS